MENSKIYTILYVKDIVVYKCNDKVKAKTYGNSTQTLAVSQFKY